MEATAVYGARPTVSYRALALGASAPEIGILASSFGALAFLCAIPAGRLADRAGGRVLFLAGTCGTGLTLIFLALAQTVPELILGQALLGLCQLTTIIGLQTTLTILAPEADRDRLVSTYSVATSLGNATGPIVAGIVAGQGGINAEPTFIGLAVVALLATLLVVRFPSLGRRRREADAGSPTSAIRLLRDPGMAQAVLASVVLLATTDIMVAYLPVYGQIRGLSSQTIGAAVGAMFLGQILSRLILSRLVVRFGGRRVLLASMALPAVLLPCLILPIDGSTVLLAMVLIGVNLGLGQPMTIILVSLASAIRDRGLAMSLRMVGNRLGQATVPALIGATAGQAGIVGLIGAVALLLAGGAVAVASGGSAGMPDAAPRAADPR